LPIGGADSRIHCSFDIGVVQLTADALSSGKGSQAKAGRASSTSGRSENRSEIKRALIKSDELMQDTRSDEAFVVIPGARSLRRGRAIWLRRPEWKDVVGENRFQHARQTVKMLA
jgi:type IV secretion system protein VirD4